MPKVKFEKDLSLLMKEQFQNKLITEMGKIGFADKKTLFATDQKMGLKEKMELRKRIKDEMV